MPQQQAKWCDVMQRPISIAMTLSVVIHLAFLMAAEWLLSDQVDASVSNPLLLVIIQPPEAQEGFSANESFSQPLRNKSVPSQDWVIRFHKAGSATHI